MKERTSPLVVLALLWLILPMIVLLYVVGYFWLGTRQGWRTVPEGELSIIERIFEHKWEAQAYYPAGNVEAFLTGVVV